jgi:hypothetical protein
METALKIDRPCWSTGGLCTLRSLSVRTTSIMQAGACLRPSIDRPIHWRSVPICRRMTRFKGIRFGRESRAMDCHKGGGSCTGGVVRLSLGCGLNWFQMPFVVSPLRDRVLFFWKAGRDCQPVP